MIGTVNLEQFAAQHNLRYQTDPEGEGFILGELGQILQWSDSVLAVYLNRMWRHQRPIALRNHFVILQHGDNEGVMSFDPTVHEQALKAIELVGAKPLASTPSAKENTGAAPEEPVILRPRPYTQR